MNSTALLPKASKIVKSSAEQIASVLVNGAKLIGSNIHQFSPHIKVITTVIVESVPKKMDYTEDVKLLLNAGLSIKDIAQMLGISLSYAYKLAKK